VPTPRSPRPGSASPLACIGAIRPASDLIERAIKARGIAILGKLTGLVLSAMASRMVFDGARHLLPR
jgi:small neutral amino acid transporter SnatA (MarC family)